MAETVRHAGLDADLDRWLHEIGPRLLDFIGTDKKRAGQRLGFVTVRAVGDCGVTEIELGELARILLP